MRRQEDHYTRLARQEGYPARSVYKLAEMQKRFGLIRRGDRILDVGASPGSWSLYLLRHCRPRIVAVDLVSLGIDPPKGDFTFIRGDVGDPSVRERIRESGPYGAVLSDAAPATTGHRTVDCARSYALVDAILDLAWAVLAPGGCFVAKVFQGGGERELLERARDGFESVRMFKPRACRKSSFETYLIGRRFT